MVTCQGMPASPAGSAAFTNCTSYIAARHMGETGDSVIVLEDWCSAAVYLHDSGNGLHSYSVRAYDQLVTFKKRLITAFELTVDHR